MKQVGTFYDS